MKPNRILFAFLLLCLLVNTSFAQTEPGFLNLNPNPNSYLNTSNVQIKADFVNIYNTTIRVFVNGLNVTSSCIISSGTSGNITCSISLSEGEHRVEINGTDTSGNHSAAEWSFIIDLTNPLIHSFEVQESDLDGFVEAGEILTLNWNVSDLNFDRVEICDEYECKIFSENRWTTSWISKYGNQKMRLIAYDKAKNSNESSKHIYNNYVAYIDSEVGKIGDLELNKTALMDLVNLSISKVEVFANRYICSPNYSEINRTAFISGTLPKNTTVRLDKNANATIIRSYNCIPVYNANDELNFSVRAPMVTKANVLLIQVNDSELEKIESVSDLVDRLSEIKSVKDLIKYSKYFYLFSSTGWAKIKPDRTLSTVESNGTININNTSISDTLKMNEVNLTTGFSINQSLPKPLLSAGEYFLVAIALDGDRVGLVASYPIIVTASPEFAVLSTTSILKNGSLSVSFSTADYIVALIVKNETYSINATLNYTGRLSTEMVKLEFKAGNQPLKQVNYSGTELPIWYPENYAKMSAEKAKNTTISVEGMPFGDYILYAVAIKDGMIYAISQHNVAIVAPDLTVTSISVNPLIANQKAMINATIANIGNANATAFNVSFFVNGSLIGNVRISGLNFNESTIASIEWTPTIAGSYVIKVFADSGNAIDEFNETNNTMEIIVTVTTLPTPTPIAPPPPPPPLIGGGAGGGAIPGVPIYIGPYTLLKAGEWAEIRLPYTSFLDTNIKSLSLLAFEDVYATIRVEKLKSLPVNISAPENAVLLLKIDLTLSKETSVRGYVTFAVEREAIKNRGFDADKVVVTMLKFDGKSWIRLKTEFLGKNDKYNYYRAEIPSFSYFAVILEAPKPTPTPTPPTTPIQPTPLPETPVITPPSPAIGIELIGGLILVVVVLVVVIAIFLRRRK